MRTRTGACCVRDANRRRSRLACFLGASRPDRVSFGLSATAVRARVAAATVAALWLASHGTPCDGETPPGLAASAHAILQSNCTGCHGQARISDLDLRSRKGLLAGGRRGPAALPGDPESSLLVRAVRRDAELQMPPGDASLSASEIDLLARWVGAGARWPERPLNTDGKKLWWSFDPPSRPEVPETGGERWVRGPIDAFVFARMGEHGLAPGPAADRRTLARRAYFDLHGLPPTPDQVRSFVEDDAPDAFERLVDRLLASPRYGERWGRYWLDLARYADTSGFETDHYYTTAWRYRDYVVDSFNSGKPFDTFVQEQIAADELWPTNMDLEGTLELPEEKRRNVARRVGTGLFTLGAFPIEYTFYGDLYRAEWQAEAVDTIGAAFLGLSLECARCHDHKSDPISQRDYYRLAAFFAGSVEVPVPLVSIYDIQTSTRSFPLLERARALKRIAKRSARRLDTDGRNQLLQRLGEAYMRAPEPYPTANVLGHTETVPATHVLAHGDFRRAGEVVRPGFPDALPSGPALNEPEGVRFVPRRRAALARWLTSAENPLLGRVMVNRIWQHHFGAGLVRTPNDYGRNGDRPTHPRLLDWLAVEFREKGWSVKEIHRIVMRSSAYRASSVASPASLQADPDNRWLSRMSRRRLDADAIRDSVLAVAGSLSLKMGGVGVIPPLSDEELLAARMPHLWPAHPDASEHVRRSVYLQVKRSMALPMLEVFDAPDTARSCARRETSTVAPQALAMMNSRFVVEQARHFAERIRREGADSGAEAAVRAWHLALGRPPTEWELETAKGVLERTSLRQFCLMLFNTNEFLYVD